MKSPPTAFDAKRNAVQNPDVPVYVAGDRAANYEVVLQAMVLLQNADVPRVGLMSAPSEAVQQ